MTKEDFIREMENKFPHAFDGFSFPRNWKEKLIWAIEHSKEKKRDVLLIGLAKGRYYITPEEKIIFKLNHPENYD